MWNLKMVNQKVSKKVNCVKGRPSTFISHSANVVHDASQKKKRHGMVSSRFYRMNEYKIELHVGLGIE
jgi:c-di-GMP-binding flagellar brake protein YcgR